MSDKMLMEDWRKYLVEAYEPGKDKRFDSAEEKASHIQKVLQGPDDAETERKRKEAEASGCLTIETIIKSIEAAQEIAEVSDDRDEFIRNAKSQGYEFGTDTLLALGVTLLKLEPLAAFFAGLAPGALRIAKNLVFPVDPNTEKGLEAFVDLINIAEPFQEVFSEPKKKRIDDEYLIYLRRNHPYDCMDKVLNINQFIQKHYKLCRDDYPSARPIQYQAAGGGGHDLTGIDRQFPKTNESKFHDDWRNFLLTEEKLCDS